MSVAQTKARLAQLKPGESDISPASAEVHDLPPMKFNIKKESAKAAALRKPAAYDSDGAPLPDPQAVRPGNDGGEPFQNKHDDW